MNEDIISFPPFTPFHIAFVTRKLEAGMETFGRMYGHPEFTIYRDAEIQTPGGIAYLNFGVADFNGVNFEVIEPAGGNDGVYREALPTEVGATRFHHVASFVHSWEDWEDVMGTVDRHELATPVKGVPRSPEETYYYVYIDMRERLGHYLEFVYDAS